MKNFDERFALDKEEVRLALSLAEKLDVGFWERKGKRLAKAVADKVKGKG